MLLDNGRTNILADPDETPDARLHPLQRALNVCPVYSRTGGHAYDSVYPGRSARFSRRSCGSSRSRGRCRLPRACAVRVPRCAPSRSTFRRSSFTFERAWSTKRSDLWLRSGSR